MTLKNSCLLFAIFFISACNEVTEKEKPVEEKVFFPLASIVHDQWKLVDSLDIPVVKMQTVNGISDTAASSLEELKKAGEELLNPDITKPPLSDQYTETSFADQSIPSITLTYSSEDKSLPVQRLDILLHPDPEANDKLRNIYMEKNEGNISKKFLFIADRSLQVITSNRDSTISIVKFTWDGLR